MNQKKEILVNNNSLWTDIKFSFSEHYPFLKIEFLQNGLKASQGIMSDAALWTTQLRLVNEPCIIDISSNRTVVQILYDFKIMLGLTVQVSRKSGNVWNVISITEGWTLEYQNAAGAFISAQPAIPINNKGL